MKERVDTFQVGPAAPGQIDDLVEAVIPDVVQEASITANGRTISPGVIMTKEGNNSIAHVFMEYKGETATPYDLIKTRTVVTEHYTAGVYNPV